MCTSLQCFNSTTFWFTFLNLPPSHTHSHTQTQFLFHSPSLFFLSLAHCSSVNVVPSMMVLLLLLMVMLVTITGHWRWRHRSLHSWKFNLSSIIWYMCWYTWTRETLDIRYIFVFIYYGDVWDGSPLSYHVLFCL